MNEVLADAGGAGGAFGDAFPGEEPQAVEDRNQRLDVDERDAWDKPEQYNFVYANGQLHISDVHDHGELAEHSGIGPDHSGPMAVGRVVVDMGKATFEMKSNLSAQGLARVLKDYCKDVGWAWGGLTDLEGEPVGTGTDPALAPVKSFRVACHGNEAIFARLQDELQGATAAIHVDEHNALVFGSIPEGAREGVLEWAEDQDLILIAGNDNVVKRIEDLEVDNNYSPEWNDAEDHFLFDDPSDERKPGGVYSCPNCSRIFPSWGTYLLHRRQEEVNSADETKDDGQFPDLDLDATFGPHESEPLQGYESHFLPRERGKSRAQENVAGIRDWFRKDPVKEYNRAILDSGMTWNPDKCEFCEQPTAYHLRHPGDWYDRYLCPEHFQNWQEDLQSGWARPEEHEYTISQYHPDGLGERPVEWKYGAAPKVPDPKDQIAGSLPFIFDVQEDSITVGRPGTRTSDIPGRFTPGGIVEGTYEPGGQVFIRSMTNMPYSVRHMLELWYYQHPHMEIKGVSLQDDEGKRTKLAAGQDIGQYIRTMAAADPVAWRAYHALKGAGGSVYVVGGAVRDALMGKAPHDIDLMVTGLPGEDVRHTLATLPGQVKLTGQDHGVYRYREGDNEVEISLPRRERDLKVGPNGRPLPGEVDHTITPEEDLFRRDFTANAMAVSLDTGTLIDPFNGVEDVQKRQLRTLNTKSLADDPLRTVRALVALSKHGLYPNEDTLDQLRAYGPLLQRIPGERIQAELDKMFAGANPGEAIRLAQDTSVLQHFMPEVSRTFGHTQNNPHHELELFDHLVNVLDRAKERKPEDGDFALAALLHDIGKYDAHWTQCQDCGWHMDGHHDTCEHCGSHNTSGHFYEKYVNDVPMKWKDAYEQVGETFGKDHATVGAQQAAELMTRLHYPRERIQRVQSLIQHHMFPAFTSEKGARKFLNQVGDHADDLLHLRWADQGGKSEYPTDPSLSVDNQMALVNQARAMKAPTNQSMLAINGRDLIAAGIPPGPQMGQLLKYLTDQVIENPQLNTRDALLGLASTWRPS